MKRKASALLFVVIASCSPERPTQPSPTPEATFDGRYAWGTGKALPTPRTEVAVASIAMSIFAAGGFDADGEATDVLEVFDVAHGNWAEGPSLPEPLHHTSLAAAGGRIYLIGGYRADGRASPRVWSLAAGSARGGRGGRWRAEPRLPTSRGALAVAVVAGQIHAVGGASTFGGRASLTGAHEAFDPARRAWRRLPDLPDERDHLAAASDGDTLYVAGGRKLSLETNSARLDVFDPATGRWARGPDMPTARGGLAAAAAGGRVFVFGGEQPQGTFGAAEVFDVDERTWSRAPDMPTPRHGLGATIIGRSVYVVGGGPEPGLTVSGANEILEMRG